MKFKSNIESQAGIEDSAGSAGTAGQILSSLGPVAGVDGVGWIDQSTIASGSAEVVEVPVKNLMGSDLKKGDPVYISGSVGASGKLEVKLADASDSNKMPAVGLLKQDLVNNEEGFVVVTGKLRNLITSPIDGATPNPNDVIYVKPNGTAGAALTLTKPTGSSNLIQNMGKVGRVSTSNDGTFIVSSILRSNDIPNLSTGKIWVGDGNTVESTVVHLDETNGRMGINTNSPDTNLEIEQSGTPGIKFNNTAGGFPTFGSITAYNNTTFRGSLTWAQNPAQNGARITYIGFPSGTQTTGTFEVGSNFVDTTINNGSMVTRLTTTGLGIGTTSPAYMLDVDGEVRVGDNQKLKLWDDPFGAIITPLDAHLALTTTRTQDNIYFDPGNSTKMVIEGGGNVGIGTTSPAQKLTIGNIGIGNTDGLKIEDPSNTAYGAHYSYDDASTTVEIGGVVNNSLRDCISIARDATRTITINTSEYVGIGTTSPQEKLHVQNYTTGESHQAMFKGGAVTVGDYSYISLNNGYSTEYNKEVRLAAVSEQSNSNKTGFAILTSPDSNGASGHERLRVTADGNVGIGTTSPSTKLHALGATVSMPALGDAPSAAHFGGSSYGTLFSTLTTGRGVIQQGRVDGTATSYDLLLQPVGGNVGIGTTSSTPIGTNITTLDIQGSSGGGLRFGTTGGVEGGLWTLGSGTTLGSISNIPLYFRTNNDTKATILTNGNFGIGTTSPSEKLEVNGNVKANNYINQRVAWNSGFLHNSNNSSSYYFVPVGYVVETTTDTYYNNWIAPYAGRVRKIVLRNIGQGTTPTATTVNFRVSVNGSVVYTGSTIAVTGSGLNISASETLSDTDAVFSATDRVQVAYRTNGFWQLVAAGISLEYTE